MKIVSFPEFAKLPVGTIYSYYEPCVCRGLMSKGDTIYDIAGDVRGGENNPIDFFEQSLTGECWNGDDPIVDEGWSRWGLFERDAQFAIYELDDLELIKSQVEKAIALLVPTSHK
jgi:hypothetical protein